MGDHQFSWRRRHLERRSGTGKNVVVLLVVVVVVAVVCGEIRTTVATTATARVFGCRHTRQQYIFGLALAHSFRRRYPRQLGVDQDPGATPAATPTVAAAAALALHRDIAGGADSSAEM